MKVAAVTVLLLVMLSTTLAHGTEYEHVVGETTHVARKASTCLEFSRVAAAECVGKFHDASEAELAMTYARIRAGLVRDRALLEDTQSRWLSFRGSECALRSASAGAFREQERQKWLISRICVAELNAERIRQLNELELGCAACLQ